MATDQTGTIPATTQPIAVGVRVGRLTIVARAADRIVACRDRPSGRRIERRWLCQCDCGTETNVREPALKFGRTKSCGCLQRDFGHRHGYARGGRYTPEYDVWRQMNERCHNLEHSSYPSYGARGIVVCDAWRNSFDAFLADMGKRPSPRHTVERRDNNVQYSPDNCCWATRSEQSRNKRSNHLLTHDGKTLCLAAWAERIGIASHTIRRRLKLGWDVAKALTTPVQPSTT